MRRSLSLLRWALVVVGGVALGVGTAVAAGAAAFRAGGVQVGPWTTNVDVGSRAASPWLRAAVAMGGFLALDRRETLYFRATADDGGRTLSRRCSYRVEGAAPAARWWSVTVYGSDAFLLPNRAHRYSFGSAALRPGQDVSFELAPRSDDAAVVPLGDAPVDGSFSLVLRLYEPAEGVVVDPASAQLPRVRRLGCR